MAFIIKLKPYVPALLWLLIILVLSGYPGSNIPKLPALQLDKLIHTFIYGVLAICMAIPYTSEFSIKKTRWSIGLKIVLLGVFHGGLMEILQENFFNNRSADWYDFFANTLGAILGVLFFPYLIKVVPINRWMRIS
jgi:VanZ family protein